VLQTTFAFVSATIGIDASILTPARAIGQRGNGNGLLHNQSLENLGNSLRPLRKNFSTEPNMGVTARLVVILK
jgi:hypothetical protein